MAAGLVNESSDLIKRKLYDRALAKLKRAALWAPGLPQSYIHIGIIYARQNRSNEAIAELKKALKCKDVPVEAYLTLATLYQTSGDLDKAIATFKEMSKKSGADYTDRSISKVLELLERERERQSASGSTESSKKQTDYLQDSLQHGFHRWSLNRMPLKVYIKPADSSSVEGYAPEYDHILRQSFFEWSKALNQKVSFLFVDDPAKANIQCFWTNAPEDLGDGAENGETRIRMIGENVISASIALRAKEPEGGFPFTENLIHMTCLHEIGHALGLSGHSSKPDDVMYCSVPVADVERKITERDKNTMVKIYEKEQALQYVLLDFLSNPAYAAMVGSATFLLFLLGIVVPRMAKRKGKKRRKL